MVRVIHAMQPDRIATLLAHQIAHSSDSQLANTKPSKRAINHQRMHPPARRGIEFIAVITQRLEWHKHATRQNAVNVNCKRFASDLTLGKRGFIKTQQPLTHALSR